MVDSKEWLKNRYDQHQQSQRDAVASKHDRTWTPGMQDALNIFSATGGYGARAEQEEQRLIKQRELRRKNGETGQRVILKGQ